MQRGMASFFLAQASSKITSKKLSAKLEVDPDKPLLAEVKKTQYGSVDLKTELSLSYIEAMASLIDELQVYTNEVVIKPERLKEFNDNCFRFDPLIVRLNTKPSSPGSFNVQKIENMHYRKLVEALRCVAYLLQTKVSQKVDSKADELTITELENINNSLQLVLGRYQKLTDKLTKNLSVKTYADSIDGKFDSSHALAISSNTPKWPKKS